MKKSISAVLVAVLITACVGVAILGIGGAALFNKNGVSSSNSPAQASDAAGVNSPQQVSQTDQQVQSLISQYQDHEQQYKQREQQLQQQLSQANTQIQQDQQTIQQFQNLLSALQQRGLIRITNDGRVFINQ